MYHNSKSTCNSSQYHNSIVNTVTNLNITSTLNQANASAPIPEIQRDFNNLHPGLNNGIGDNINLTYDHGYGTDLSPSPNNNSVPNHGVNTGGSQSSIPNVTLTDNPVSTPDSIPDNQQSINQGNNCSENPNSYPS